MLLAGGCQIDGFFVAEIKISRIEHSTKLIPQLILKRWDSVDVPKTVVFATHLPCPSFSTRYASQKPCA